jgi:hypothetical protein
LSPGVPALQEQVADGNSIKNPGFFDKTGQNGMVTMQLTSSGLHLK